MTPFKLTAFACVFVLASSLNIPNALNTPHVSNGLDRKKIFSAVQVEPQSPTAQAGDYVKIVGLRKSMQYNNRVGQVVKFDSGRNRLVVKLPDTEHTIFTVLPSNIEMINEATYKKALMPEVASESQGWKIEIQDRVSLKDLRENAEYNGKEGVIERSVGSPARWIVRLDDSNEVVEVTQDKLHLVKPHTARQEPLSGVSSTAPAQKPPAQADQAPKAAAPPPVPAPATAAPTAAVAASDKSEKVPEVPSASTIVGKSVSAVQTADVDNEIHVRLKGLTFDSSFNGKEGILLKDEKEESANPPKYLVKLGDERVLVRGENIERIDGKALVPNLEQDLSTKAAAVLESVKTDLDKVSGDVSSFFKKGMDQMAHLKDAQTLVQFAGRLVHDDDDPDKSYAVKMETIPREHVAMVSDISGEALVPGKWYHLRGHDRDISLEEWSKLPAGEQASWELIATDADMKRVLKDHQQKKLTPPAPKPLFLYFDESGRAKSDDAEIPTQDEPLHKETLPPGTVCLEDNGEHIHRTFRSDFSGQVLQLGHWYHKQGESYDITDNEYLLLLPSQKASYIPITSVKQVHELVRNELHAKTVEPVFDVKQPNGEIPKLQLIVNNTETEPQTEITHVSDVSRMPLYFGHWMHRMGGSYDVTDSEYAKMSAEERKKFVPINNAKDFENLVIADEKSVGKPTSHYKPVVPETLVDKVKAVFNRKDNPTDVSEEAKVAPVVPAPLAMGTTSEDGQLSSGIPVNVVVPPSGPATIVTGKDLSEEGAFVYANTNEAVMNGFKDGARAIKNIPVPAPPQETLTLMRGNEIIPMANVPQQPPAVLHYESPDNALTAKNLLANQMDFPGLKSRQASPAAPVQPATTDALGWFDMTKAKSVNLDPLGLFKNKEGEQKAAPSAVNLDPLGWFKKDAAADNKGSTAAGAATATSLDPLGWFSSKSAPASPAMKADMFLTYHSDRSGDLLTPGNWYHRLGANEDITSQEWLKLPKAEKIKFVRIDSADDIKRIESEPWVKDQNDMIEAENSGIFSVVGTALKKALSAQSKYVASTVESWAHQQEKYYNDLKLNLIKSVPAALQHSDHTFDGVKLPYTPAPLPDLSVVGVASNGLDIRIAKGAKEVNMANVLDSEGGVPILVPTH